MDHMIRLMKNIFVFSPMGIMAIDTPHSIEALMHFIPVDTLLLVTIKAEIIATEPQQLFIFRTMGIMT